MKQLSVDELRELPVIQCRKNRPNLIITNKPEKIEEFKELLSRKDIAVEIISKEGYKIKWIPADSASVYLMLEEAARVDLEAPKYSHREFSEYFAAFDSVRAFVYGGTSLGGIPHSVETTYFIKEHGHLQGKFAKLWEQEIPYLPSFQKNFRNLWLVGHEEAANSVRNTLEGKMNPEVAWMYKELFDASKFQVNLIEGIKTYPDLGTIVKDDGKETPVYVVRVDDQRGEILAGLSQAEKVEIFKPFESVILSAEFRSLNDNEKYHISSVDVKTFGHLQGEHAFDSSAEVF